MCLSVQAGIIAVCYVYVGINRYVSKYCGFILLYCPAVHLVHGLCVSLCNGRELPVLRNSQCCSCFIL